MKLVYSEEFLNDLDKIIMFIAQDSPQRAAKFADDLIVKISDIPNRPYSFRKNPKLNRKDTRDLVFKGYTVAFRVSKDVIKILAIFKRNSHAMK